MPGTGHGLPDLMGILYKGVFYCEISQDIPPAKTEKRALEKRKTEAEWQVKVTCPAF